MALSTTTKQNLTLAGVVFLAFAIPLTVVAIRIASDIRSRAKPTETPVQVFVTNLSESSATITWITKENETEGFVTYGTTADVLTSPAFDERDSSSTPGNYKTHSVSLRNLSAVTQYFYKITVGDEEYDNAGAPYSFSTLPASDEGPGTPSPAEGSVTPSTEDILIYSFASTGTTRSTIVSALTNSSGNYTFDRTSLKNSASGDQFALSNADIITFAQGADLGTGEVQYIASEKPQTIGLSSSGSGIFNPDRTVTLLPRTGGETPPPAAPSISDLITASTSLTGADSDPTIPINIRISNISDTSFTVSWLTREATTGSVLYGTSSPTEIALDDRDGSIDLASKRFTHSATVSEATFTADQSVVFQVSSNSKLYDSAGENFEFAIPKVLASPPSLDVISGSVAPIFENTLGLEDPRDFLILGRVTEGGENSTWVTSVPAENKGWNLNIASVRTQELDAYFGLDGAQIKLDIFGELNSFQDATLAEGDETYDFDPESGLSVTSFNHTDEISVLELIEGTAEPSATVTVAFNGPQEKSFTVSADEDGKWELNISEIELGGEYEITIESGGSVLGISADVSLEALPDTALRDIYPYLPGAILIILGLGIIYWVRQTRLNKQYE